MDDDDPLRALAALNAFRGELESRIREQALRALGNGRSYGEIARALGVSRQAAHRRYRQLAPPRVAATPETRRLLRVAREEALMSNDPTLGGEHLLVAALRCGGRAAEALAAAGVSLEDARVSAHAVATARASSAGVRTVVREAAKTVAARGGRSLDTNALLVSALADPDGGACQLLAALDVDPASIRGPLSPHIEASKSRVPRRERNAA